MYIISAFEKQPLYNGKLILFKKMPFEIRTDQKAQFDLQNSYEWVYLLLSHWILPYMSNRASGCNYFNRRYLDYTNHVSLNRRPKD